MADNIKIAYIVDKKQLEASNKELEKTVKGNDLTQKEVAETTKKFAAQDKQLSKTNKAFAGVGDQLKSLGNRFTIAGKGAGDLAAGMFAGTKATGGMSKAMKILKFAIASTGIGLLIVGLVSLKAAFTSSEGGQNKFAKIMASIGVIVGNVSDIFAGIGEKIISAFENPKQSIASFGNLVKTNIVNRFNGLIELIPQLGKAIVLLFEGEFTQAGIVAGDAVAKLTLGVEDFSAKAVSGYEAAVEASKNFVAQTNKEVAEAQRLADLTAATNKLQREFVVRTAELEGKVADLRLKGRQEDEFTAKQRLAFLKEANDLQNELIETESIIAKNRAEEIRISNTFSKSTIENLDAEAEAEANVFRVETKRLNQQRTLQREINTTSKQAEAALIAEQKAKEKIEEEAAEKAAEEKEKEEEIAKELKEKKIVDAKEEADRDLALANAKIGLAFAVSGSLQAIAGQGSALGKVLALGEIAYSTGKAIASLTAASQANPLNSVTFGGAGIAQYAAGIAIIGANIASAKSILASAPKVPKFEHGGRVGGNLHSGGGTMIEAELDEHVMSRKATSKYGHGFFKALNNLELSPDVLSGLSGGSTPIIINSDNKELINEYRSRPNINLSIDENGITKRTQRNNSIIQKKVLRYKS